MLLKVLLFASIASVDANGSSDPVEHDAVDVINHKFYDLYTFDHDSHLIHLDSIKLSGMDDSIVHEGLSNSDDAPEIRIDLPWDFKFYGHLHDWIAISPNGFLTTHAIAYGTFWGDGYRRYMAPLMADFNPAASTHAKIYYRIDEIEKSFSVQWQHVPLYFPSYITPSDDRWDFQIKIKHDGTIMFYYFDIPSLPEDVDINATGILYDYYSQTIGLEDAAYQHVQDGYYYIRALEPIDVDPEYVLAKKIVMFRPKETCLDQFTCDDCKAINANEENASLQCGWCPVLGVCSDGLGREIFEYTTHDYCTEDEMIDHLELEEEECIPYEVNSRECHQNDHVLAKWLPGDDSGKYYSGMIHSIDVANNEFLIMFDDPNVSNKYLPPYSVHPCSTVSWEYDSYEVPPLCTPHCTSLYEEVEEGTNGGYDSHNGGHSEGTSSTSKGKYKTAIIVVLLLVVLAGGVIGFYLCKRRASRGRMQSRALGLVDQNATRGVAIPDEPDDETFTSPSPRINQFDLSQGPSDLEDDADLNRLNHMVVSPPPKWKPRAPENDSYQQSIPESNSQVVELQIESEQQIESVQQIEMESIELQSVHVAESIPDKVNDDPQNVRLEGEDGVKREWDMTPLGQDE